MIKSKIIKVEQYDKIDEMYCDKCSKFLGYIQINGWESMLNDNDYTFCSTCHDKLKENNKNE